MSLRRSIKFSVTVILVMLLTGCFSDSRAPIDPVDPKINDTEEKSKTPVPEEKPIATVPEEKPIATVPEEKPIATLPEEKPVAIVPEEKPIVILPEEKPVATIPEEKPKTPVPEEKPKTPEPEIPPATVRAPFSVELNTPDTVEQNTLFTLMATPEQNEGAVSYKWTLNNIVTPEEVSVSRHLMLPVVGDYVLRVFATDEAGYEFIGVKSISVVAQASLNTDFSFGINVSDKSGYALSEVPVTINGTTISTDQFGLAQFDGISQTPLMLVSASKEGYLTQTYQYSFDATQENAMATLTLQGINPVSHTIDSTQAVDVTETELHTKLMLDANSFVDDKGVAVTGDVKITITPIDIRAVDSAFLGGGQALTNSGEAVALISTGMADYQFTQNGSAVSLAEGASATIEMDLAVATGDDGRIFADGDTIEMWWFDTKTGFWVEDGVGTVALSDTSETGLKLVAVVNHFTTWNWDYYKQDDRSSITFNCLKDGQALATNESCQITASSISINRQMVAGSEGVTAVNTSPNVTYSVTANLTSGDALWSGEATITTVAGDNAVSINMAPITTQTGYVQCRIINHTVTSIVPCNNVITAGSIGPQNIDTAEFNNYRASFIYVKNDSLGISTTLNGGSNQTTLIDDTNSINGTLDLEIVFDIKLGWLKCSATLNGGDMEYFPCDALVTDSEGIESPIWAKDFSGTPLRTSFTYTKDAQDLRIEVVSIFDEAEIYQEEGYDVGGEPRVIDIDLTTESAVAHATYDVSPENLYTFVCIDEEGSNLDCDINWYNSVETLIFSGNITELSGPDILPKWMNGKIFIGELNSDGSPVGTGEARWEINVQELYFESNDPDVDIENRVITFTLTKIEPS
jgi:hypothetical protein